MKTILRCTILAFLATAHAEELQFDLTGTALVNPGIGPVDVSFMLDTTRSTSSFFFANSFLSSFEGIAALSNFNVLLNGQLAFSMSQLNAGFGGSNWTNLALGGCFCGMTFPNLGIWEFDAEPGITQARMEASSDPLATLLLNFQWDPGAATGYVAMRDESTFQFDRVTVTDLGPSTVADPPVDVPEPATLALLILGLAAVVGLRGFRRPAVSAGALHD